MTAWLSVVGMGEDGLDGLRPTARSLVEAAEVLVGGERLLEKVPAGPAERIPWGPDLEATIERLAALSGRRVTVLASGDPLHYGVGACLVRRFGPGEMTVEPAPGAFSLAAARMGWPLADVETLTVHGRPPETLNRHLAPRARLLILSRDGDTPSKVAALLRQRGYGPSTMTVLEHLGGPDEGRRDGEAATWNHPRARDLNTIALQCRLGEDASAWSRAPGLPDDAFEHDGVITKREVRAITLAALVPLPHQTLWDVGAGSGTVAIEWMRAERTARAVAVERNPARAATIALNAAKLGVPGLRIVEGEAPAALRGLEPAPDALFIGGGLDCDGLLDACWRALAPDGRLVANAVTLEAQQRLLAAHRTWSGDLVHIAVSRTAPLGGLTVMRPLTPVLQYAVVKR